MMAERHYNPPSSAYSNRSPLDTLVRKTSNRALAAGQRQPPQQPRPPILNEPDFEPPRARARRIDDRPPASPLLHSSFNNRDSIATASAYDTNSSYMDLGRESVDWKNYGQVQQSTVDWSQNIARYRGSAAPGPDDESVYSRASAFVPEPALRDSWQTSGGPDFLPSNPYPAYNGPSISAARSSPHVPAVVVSTPHINPDPSWQDDDDDPRIQQPRKGGRIPIASNAVYASSTSSVNLHEQPVRRAPIIRSPSNRSNYSMPMRAAPLESEEDEQQRKQAILARHGGGVNASPSQARPWDQGSGQGQPSSLYTSHGAASSSSSFNRQPSPITPSPDSPHSQGMPHPQRSLTPGSHHTTTTYSPEQVSLPRRPPSLRVGSPTEPYDRYSYYDMASPAHSDGEESRATTPSGLRQPQNLSKQQLLSPQASRNQMRAPSPLSPSHSSHAPAPPGGNAEPNLTNPSTAWDFLHLGINAHLASKPTAVNVGSPSSSKFPRRGHETTAKDNEQNLQQSAIYFEKSATIGGGCPMGMLMWGLALRHGWGVAPREKDAFTWLRSAAEGVLGSMGGGGGSTDDLQEKSAMVSEKGLGPDVQSELVVAIYEVGQCFFQGWGVPKDKIMAVSYYRTAARLGDVDAQTDLAFCLANGKGCKKDRKEAAKWYRAAVAQGQSDVGLAWIHKDKFQDT